MKVIALVFVLLFIQAETRAPKPFKRDKKGRITDFSTVEHDVEIIIEDSMFLIAENQAMFQDFENEGPREIYNFKLKANETEFADRCKQMPRWNEEKYEGFKKFEKVAALIFVLEDGTILGQEEGAEHNITDWRIALIGKLINILRKFDNDYVPLVPIIHSWDLEEGNENIPSLADYLKISKKDTVPQVYMV